MDAETIGVIEESIKFAFEKQNVTETLHWVVDADSDIRLTEDFTLGYILGALINITINIARLYKDSKTFKERFEKFKKAQEKNPQKRFRNIQVSLTQEEEDRIRDMLKLWIEPFREKIRKEIAINSVGKNE